MPKNSLTPSTIVGAVAAFLGAAGILAGVGFLVQQAHFVLQGAPTPPFAAIDYLRVAGYFLFDLIVLVLLLYGVLWGVLPSARGPLVPWGGPSGGAPRAAASPGPPGGRASEKTCYVKVAAPRGPSEPGRLGPRSRPRL